MDEPSEKFKKCHEFTMRMEGGLSDDPHDSGGITKYGVSIVFLSDLAKWNPGVVAGFGIRIPVTSETIRNLTKDQAERLFHHEFWIPNGCDGFPAPVALCLYDMSVNHGRSAAVKIMQRAANAFGIPLSVDGIIGPKSREAFARMGCSEGVSHIASSRQKYYDAIIARRPDQKVFARGWSNRCRAMKNFSLYLLTREQANH